MNCSSVNEHYPNSPFFACLRRYAILSSMNVSSFRKSAKMGRNCFSNWSISLMPRY